MTRAFPGVCSFHYCGQRERRGATQWLGYDEIAVVTGVLSADRKIQARMVRAVP